MKGDKKKRWIKENIFFLAKIEKEYNYFIQRMQILKWIELELIKIKFITNATIAYPWRNSYSTSISVYGM